MLKDISVWHLPGGIRHGAERKHVHVGCAGGHGGAQFSGIRLVDPLAAKSYLSRAGIE